MFIDADTHVDECEDTWSYFPKSAAHLVPRTVEFEKDQIPSWSPPISERMWFIDGQLYPRRYRNNEATDTTPEQRELRDVPARIKDMDELDVSIQVLYTTLFLEELTLKPEVDVALCASYNRWLADRCGDSKGRIKWVALLPYNSMPDALTEMRWAKENGACGIYKRGFEAGGRTVNDPYFFDVYAAAADLDLAVCLHAATAWLPVSRNYTAVRASMMGALANIGAFQTYITSRIPEQFPGLRLGFIESGSAWLTFILSGLKTSGGTRRRYDLPETADGARWAEAMRESRLFVTSEVQEDIPYLIANVGDDNLMIGSDYSHKDRSGVKDAHEQIMARDDISRTSAEKLTTNNAASFYGFAIA